MNRWRLLSLAASLVLARPALPAQAPGGTAIAGTSALRLFLDCNADGCDVDFIRTNLTWVNHVRDRLASQVHVIATSQPTGSGGSEVTLHFIGMSELAGMTDTVRFSNAQGASSTEQRAELLRVLKIGLARYAIRTAESRSLNVTFQAPATIAKIAPPRDRWNSWVFSLSGSGSAGGESSSDWTNVSSNFSARRITELWKFQLYLAGNRTRTSYTLNDGSIFKANTDGWSTVGALVRSVGARAATGFYYSASASSVDNIDLQGRIAPTLEVDLFPYRDYSRKLLIFSYGVGLNSFDYVEPTVYNLLAEERIDHRASISFALRQPWGQADLGVSAWAYLPDQAQNRLSTYGSFSVRVVRGLQVYASASYSRVRDQISLAKGRATDEQVLLRLRQLRTDFRYSTNIGLSYTFGSVFNNVVNPRMSLP